MNPHQRTKTLSTGLAFLDQSISRGLARQKISAWVGPASSGKTSLLRSVIQRWLNCGFEIAYVDTQDKLLASNWIYLENSDNSNNSSKAGKFWLVRNLENKDYLWATEALIRSQIFDVLILDIDLEEQSNAKFNTNNWQSTKVYTRLQNILSKSKTALLLLTTTNHLSNSWHFYARLDFHWGSKIEHNEGLTGKTTLLPTINCSITKNGISQNTEVPIIAYAANRLFTHSPVPDRRTAKA